MTTQHSKIPRFVLTAIILLLSFFAFGQSYKKLDKVFDRINDVPWFEEFKTHKTTNKQSNKPNRGAFNEFIGFDTSAVPFLIDKLTDTTLCKILNPCTKIYLRKCELALYLLKDIEKFDERIVTETLWDDYDDCGLCSVSFRLYFADNRIKFQDQYRKYFMSNERQLVLKSRIK